VDGDLPPEIAVIEAAPGVRVIKVACELDMLSTPSLSDVLAEQLSQQPVGVIVDLSEFRLLSAKGLTALEAAWPRLRWTVTADSGLGRDLPEPGPSAGHPHGKFAPRRQR
jgi:hypothetical protein